MRVYPPRITSTWKGTKSHCLLADRDTPDRVFNQQSITPAPAGSPVPRDSSHSEIKESVYSEIFNVRRVACWMTRSGAGEGQFLTYNEDFIRKRSRMSDSEQLESFRFDYSGMIDRIFRLEQLE
jgi:hypothetical protein